MTIVHKLVIIAIFTSTLLSGCRMLTPSDKPFLAGEYIQRAEMAGAAEFAPDEYQRLRQEFLQLEELHRKHQSAAVDERLPRFIAAADKLVELTRQNISKAEALTAATLQTALPATTGPVASAAETKPATLPGERSIKLRLSYTVSEGELLWTIAKRPDVYGDPLLWPLLYQANRDQIKDPRKIYAGQTLAIPRNVSDEEREKARNLAKKSDFFSPE